MLSKEIHDWGPQERFITLAKMKSRILTRPSKSFRHFMKKKRETETETERDMKEKEELSYVAFLKK